MSAQIIKSRLHELRRLIRSSLVLRALSLLCVAAAPLSLLSLALDRSFRLSLPGRYVTSFASLALLGWLSWRFLFRPWLVSLSDSALADLLEKKFPWLEDRLRSAVDFVRDHRVSEPSSGDEPPVSTSPQDLGLLMKRRVLEEATREVSRLDSGELVDTPRVVATLTGAVAALTAMAILAVAWRETFTLWYRRNVLFEDVEWPYRTVLEAEGFSRDLTIGVPRGDPLTIRVRALKSVPDRVRIRIAYPKESLRYNLVREGEDVFLHRHNEVTEPFQFVVEGGDFRSRPHRVVVMERPEVEKLRVMLEYPAYTGREAQTLEGDLGEMALPEGTAVRIEAAATKELEKAWLEAEGREIDLPVSPENPRRFEGSYVPKDGGTVTVHLRDKEGVPPNQWLRFIVTPVPDRAPTVLVRTEGIGSMISPNARIPLKVRATDDYGVVALGAEHEVSGEKEEPVKGRTSFPPLKKEGPQVEEEPVWEIGPLQIQPEKRLDLRVFALDNDAIHGAKMGYAATQSFLVVTPEKLGEEFFRREEEQRRLVERLVAEERNARDATYRLIDEAWKIEGSIKEEVVKEMVSLAKTERQLSRQAASVSAAMRLILDEMKNNRVGAVEETERLAGAVIEPLNDLAETLLPEASRKIGVIREMPKAADRVREGLSLAADLENIIGRLESVLSSMKRLEGFTEVVNRLRSIIKVQEESAEAARKFYRREVEEIFEDPEIKKPQAGPDDPARGGSGSTSK